MDLRSPQGGTPMPNLYLTRLTGLSPYTGWDGDDKDEARGKRQLAERAVGDDQRMMTHPAPDDPARKGISPPQLQRVGEDAGPPIIRVIPAADPYGVMRGFGQDALRAYAE